MEIAALTLIVVAVAAWVIQPLRRVAPDEPRGAPDPRAELEARRRQLLLALQDLDFELQTGKLSREDHGALRGKLEAEAVEVLRRIEEARAGAPGS